jgi:beta-barrel assembly-enhancing protease
MQIRVFYLLFLFIGFSITIFPSNFDDYKPLRSSGSVPKDFTDRTSSKVAKDVTEEIDSKDKNRIKAAKSEFLLKANYMVDELLMSGKVLFGDEVSNYVNKIADKLLENDKELRSKLRFYVLKSNVTNAFATNQGMIFVTLGLISQIETEAQLAFVLGHEIIHYKNKHLISTIIEADKSHANRKSYYKNYDENIRKLSQYSRSLETESDSLGFYFMERAGYELKAGLQVMDVLQFSYLPFEEEALDYSLFESEHFKLPAKFKLDTIVPIKFEYDEDDSKSSHPNLNKRRASIEELIKISGKKGVAFHFPKEEFFKIRNICRMESIRLNLKDGMYARSIYNTSILLKQFKDSKYLKKSLAKGLYGIAKYHSINKYHRIVEDYTYYEGNISSTFFLFEKMESKEALAFSIRQIWIIYLETEDQFINGIN